MHQQPRQALSPEKERPMNVLGVRRYREDGNPRWDSGA
jgi:hypothetical protein